MEERTEKPTPRKLKKARERGERAHSTELSAALILLGSVLLLGGLASLFANRFQCSFTTLYATLKNPELEGAFERGFGPLLLPVLLFFIGVFLLAWLSHFFQIGWVWKRMRNTGKGEFRFFYLPLKMGVIALIAFLVLKKEWVSCSLFMETTFLQKIDLIFKKIYYFLLELSLALLLLGFCDFFYQKWKFYKKMHMTSQERKDEQRETEGDRETKSKLRRQ